MRTVPYLRENLLSLPWKKLCLTWPVKKLCVKESSTLCAADTEVMLELVKSRLFLPVYQFQIIASGQQ